MNAAGAGFVFMVLFFRLAVLKLIRISIDEILNDGCPWLAGAAIAELSAVFIFFSAGSPTTDIRRKS
jgi:hypothetical protein